MGHVGEGAAPIVAATGLAREARIVSGPLVVVTAGGGDRARLAADLRRLAVGARGLISIGIAGALAPDLRVGDAVIGMSVASAGLMRSCDTAWRGALAAALPQARQGIIAGSDKIASTAADKARLRLLHGAIAVDMESHVAGAVAHDLGLPFAVVRFISDTAERGLPKAALVGMRPDGGVDVAAVLGCVAADPRQIPALIRTGLEAEAAFRALLRGRDRLGPALGFPDI